MTESGKKVEILQNETDIRFTKAEKRKSSSQRIANTSLSASQQMQINQNS
jgi:hypothetical protein